MSTVEENKYEKSEELNEIDETHTDRIIQTEKEEPKKKLVFARRQVCYLDEVMNTVKRPSLTYKSYENPHTLTTSLLKEPLQLSPILRSPKVSNPANLKLSSAQDQGDLPETLDPQHNGEPQFQYHLYKEVVMKENEANHMKKVHKDDSSDSEYLVEKVLLYRMEMDVETVKKREYKVPGEAKEINEVHIDRVTIMGNSTYGDSALGDNARDEQTVEPWPTEAPEVSEKKENRSVGGHEETNQATSDDKTKGTTITEEKLKIGRNNEEKHLLDENSNKELDVREYDKCYSCNYHIISIPF